MDHFWIVIGVIVIAQALQAAATWAAKAAIEQGIKSQFDRDLEALKALLQTKSAHEQRIITSYVEISWDLSEKSALITHKTIQLLASISREMSDGKSRKHSDTEILEGINKLLKDLSPEIVEGAMFLKKSYALLPVDIIRELQNFETIIWTILRELDMGALESLLDQNDRLLTALRKLNADLLEGRATLPGLLRDAPQDGYTPSYLREAALGRSGAGSVSAKSEQGISAQSGPDSGG